MGATPLANLFGVARPDSQRELTIDRRVRDSDRYPRATRVSFRRGSGWEVQLAGGNGHGAKLLHQTRDVYEVPMLHHLAVPETEDVGYVEVWCRGECRTS